MVSQRWAVTPLRIFLAILLGVLLLLQVMSLPGQFAHMAQESPEMAHLRWPLTAITVFWVLCAQVVVVCTWKLLTLVSSDRIFTPSSLKWVDVIMWAIAAGWAVLLGVFLVVGFNANDPGLPLLLFLVLTSVTVLGLLMVVMRALLRQATSLRADMEAVI